MNSVKLDHIEKELKKRHPYPYKWYRKQNDQWDFYTNFIYNTDRWDKLIQKVQTASERYGLGHDEVFQYAANRWYNFLSAQAVEAIFYSLEGVIPVKEVKDREKDFYLFGIPFDHKTSVFPKKFGRNFNYAFTHKPELIEWLYKNQSVQKRHHLKNRLFIVVHNQNGSHWKLKAKLSLLKKAIEEYVADFKPEQLYSFSFGNVKIQSDIIWVNTNLH